MARLLDDLICDIESANESLRFGEIAYATKDKGAPDHAFGMSLDSLPLIVIDDVVRSFFDPQEDDKLVDFYELPRYAPPYQHFFIEGRFPQHVMGLDAIAMGGPVAVGDYEQMDPILRARFAPSAPANTKWVWIICLLYHYKQKPFAEVKGRWRGFSDKNGKLLNFETSFPGRYNDVKRIEYLPALFYPFCFAISLMNCRNVQRELVEPPPALSRKREKEKGSPLHSYHVLKIRPMVKVKTSRHIQADEPEPQPLSMVRGHFKDYSKGAGLYGKWRDVFWWDAFTRGEAQAGVSVHDYEVLSD